MKPYQAAIRSDDQIEVISEVFQIFKQSPLGTHRCQGPAYVCQKLGKEVLAESLDSKGVSFYSFWEDFRVTWIVARELYVAKIVEPIG